MHFSRKTLVALAAAACFVGLCGAGLPVAQAAEKTVNMALFWLDADIDPKNGWNGWTLSRAGVGENLVQIDENLQFKPSIAERWEKVDELTTRFYIREGVTFHNGKKVDAAAVKASIERAFAESDRNDVKFPVDAITAEGATLTIKTKEPVPTLVNMLAESTYIIVDAEAAKAMGEDFKFKPVCTGAFKVDSFDPQTGLTLSAHAGHWKGKPHVDKVNAKYIPDAKTRSLALQSGELDFAAQLAPMDLTILEKDPKLQVLVGPNLRIFLIRPNMEHKVLQSLPFRQALHHAMQRDLYAEKIVGGVPARGPFNELMPFGYKGADAYPHDLAKAKALLDQAGIKDTNGNGIREFEGKDITLIYLYATNHAPDAKNIGLAMQDDLKKLGIGMELQQMDNYAEATKAGKYDLRYERWTSAPSMDPQYFLESAFKTNPAPSTAGNVGFYSNPDLDALIGELAGEQDQEKRRELGAKGAKMLMDDVAAIFIFYQNGNVVYNKRIEGVYRFPSETHYIDDRLKLAGDK